jgi:hypothetical protein
MVIILPSCSRPSWNETNKAVSDYSQEEKDAIFGATAIDFYRIEQDIR